MKRPRSPILPPGFRVTIGVDDPSMGNGGMPLYTAYLWHRKRTWLLRRIVWKRVGSWYLMYADEIPEHTWADIVARAHFEISAQAD